MLAPPHSIPISSVCPYVGVWQFPAPDRSAEVWTVLVVFVAFFQGSHQNIQVVFVSLEVHVSLRELVFSGHNPPTLKHFSRSDQSQTFSISSSHSGAGHHVHNTWGVFGETLVTYVSGNAASDWPVIAANCVCAESVHAVVNLATLNT